MVWGCTASRFGEAHTHTLTATGYSHLARVSYSFSKNASVCFFVGVTYFLRLANSEYLNSEISDGIELETNIVE